MTTFLALAALLVLVAVAFATLTLWRSSRTLAIALALLIPASAAGLYVLKGEPSALDPKNVAAPATLDDAIVQLENRLAADPKNAEGWLLLARAHMSLQHFERARAAYAQAMKLAPADDDVAVEYAEAMLRTSPDHRFPAEAVKLLRNALARHPDNQRALFFLGMHQLQDKQAADAARTWESLLPLLGKEAANALRPQINLARAGANLPPLPAPVQSAARELQLDIGIDPALSSSIRPADVVYVFARALDGKGPPLAVKRLPASSLPLHVTLGDADSPMPAAKLSSQAKVLLMARLSRSGDVSAASGDIESAPMEVRTDDGKAIILTLDRTIP